MPQEERSYPRPPMSLIVTGQEWVSLSMMTLFSPRGYAVLRAFTAAQALQRTAEAAVDLLVIDRDLRDAAGTELVERLRSSGAVSETTPVLLISPGAWPREEQLEALRAGAWDVCSLPMDSEALFLKVDAWVRAKLAGDVTREQGLLDPDTGLYNAQGLLRRIAELGAMAGRHRRPLACLVLSADAPEADIVAGTATPLPAGSESAAEDRPASGRSAAAAGGWTLDQANRLAASLQRAGRSSDIIGRLNATQFVIVAPDTDTDGVVGLAERLRARMAELAESGGEPWQLRFGCYAVSNFRDASIAPTEMLVRATEALRHADAEPRQSIQVFRPARGSMN
jgi:PleD family two-component response regulator